MANLFPVYKFMSQQWGKREYLFFATTDRKALDFACAWNRSHPETNGTYLAPSFEEADPRVSAKPDHYRGWHLDFEYGYHTATHDNYDASYEGPEDGWVDNGLKLSERSLEVLIIEIDMHEASSPMSRV